MALPRHILDRVDRVYAYHRATRLSFNDDSKRTDGSTETPGAYLQLADYPKIPLPTTLLDLPLGILAVMESSLEALPDSFITPPQTLKTLASWLYMANGLLGKRDPVNNRDFRTCPSNRMTFPFEIYVAVFSLHDLEPGFYHYNPREFSLRKLREGDETLAQIKRGRPDLEFIKRAPAALLVSTVYCRASAQFGARGYRTAMLDAGALVQNLVTTASGLGIQTITRLRMAEATMRELIGISPEAGFAEEESVQAMVVWADRTQREVILTNTPAAAARVGVASSSESVAAESPDDEPATSARRDFTINAGGAAVATLDASDLMLPAIGRRLMPPIPRQVPTTAMISYGTILAVHEDCSAPGVTVREIRPPLTELSPLPLEYPAAAMSPTVEHGSGEPLRLVLLRDREPEDFIREPVPRDVFRAVNRLAFAGGSFFPMFPAGPHVGLVRPFWVFHQIAGMDDGIWYYRADVDEWCMLRQGEFRMESRYLCREAECFGSASAVCFMVANLHLLMNHGGPHIYRLAHLEAGTVAQRISLAARGFGFASRTTAEFYDDELRKFLGLEQTGWEPLCAAAIGVPLKSDPAGSGIHVAVEDSQIGAESNLEVLLHCSESGL